MRRKKADQHRTERTATDSSRPPEPPDLPRRIRFRPARLVGLVVLLAVPALATLGLIGVETDQASVEASGLMLHVDYPRRAHYGSPVQLVMHVANKTSSTTPNIEARIPASYLSGFQIESALPQWRNYGEDLLFDLAPLPPGSESRIVINLQPEKPGRFRGTARFQPSGASEALVSFQTVIFP